ncbi:MFS general substrate transporter [Mollisia scopiformis]|uniref:MFS general substrate transporter n=1 Tax=Mollisia scopiformis TaxID=149040 RepID=A0A194X081_MOLSC|nr:MFS general substrate transporter [Mollisia scopiformis]KUJ13364.1 MFS general substrate transporter [Mollisia scopiformis]
MTFGILEIKGGGHVPGTALLEDVQSAQQFNAAHLKHGTGQHEKTVLVPQPSNDPNDPLNWPLWQRDIIFLLLCYCTILCAGTQSFGISFTQVSQLTGYQLCAVGALGVFMSTWTRVYGKRPVFVFSMLFCLAGTIWGGVATSYNFLLGARVLQGCGVCVWESVMYSIVGDLYFVHERGARMAFFGTCASGFGNFGSLIAGVVAKNLGWRWCFYVLNIFLGIGTIAIIFFGWETVYRRDAALFDTDVAADTGFVFDDTKPSVVEEEAVNDSLTLKRNSFPRRLALYSGRYTNQSFFSLTVRPFVICVNPAVIWSTLTIAVITTWQVLMSLVISQVFSAPPFNLDSAQTGYLYGGPIIGAVLGAIFCGSISDRIAEYMAKKNNGIYEPEFRLVLFAGMAVLSALGFFLFGNLIAKGASPVSIAFYSVAVGTYMVDGYRGISIEVFIIGMIAKNFMCFGFTFFMNNWAASWGPARLFNCLGGIQVGICVTAIPMYILGKRCRSYFRDHSIYSTET